MLTAFWWPPWLSPSGRRGKNKLSEETNLKSNAAGNVDDKIVDVTLNRTSKVNPTTKPQKMAPMILDRKLNWCRNYRMLLRSS